MTEAVYIQAAFSSEARGGAMASDGDKKQPSNTGAKLIQERSMNKETLVCIVYIIDSE